MPPLPYDFPTAQDSLSSARTDAPSPAPLLGENQRRWFLRPLLSYAHDRVHFLWCARKRRELLFFRRGLPPSPLRDAQDFFHLIGRRVCFSYASERMRCPLEFLNPPPDLSLRPWNDSFPFFFSPSPKRIRNPMSSFLAAEKTHLLRCSYRRRGSPLRVAAALFLFPYSFSRLNESFFQHF